MIEPAVRISRHDLRLSWASDHATSRDMAGRWDNYYGGETSSYEKSFGWIMDDEDKLKTVTDSVVLLKTEKGKTEKGISTFYTGWVRV